MAETVKVKFAETCAARSEVFWDRHADHAAAGWDGGEVLINEAGKVYTVARTPGVRVALDQGRLIEQPAAKPAAAKKPAPKRTRKTPTKKSSAES